MAQVSTQRGTEQLIGIQRISLAKRQSVRKNIREKSRPMAATNHHALSQVQLQSLHWQNLKADIAGWSIKGSLQLQNTHSEYLYPLHNEFTTPNYGL